MDEMISIIVPVYNVQDYLEICLESILNQSYKNLEIILVDDCSGDSSTTICEKYLKSDIRIKLIKNEYNEGMSATRNIGLEHAKGEYVAFVDADDFINTEYIKDLYYACITTQSLVAQCDFVTVDENVGIRKHESQDFIINEYGEIEGTKAFEDEYYQDIYHEDILDGNEVFNNMYIFSGRDMIKNMYNNMGRQTSYIWTKLYKRELFDPKCEYKITGTGTGIKFPEGRIHEEEAVVYRIFYMTDRVAYIDKPLYNYRMVSNSITRKKFSYKRLDNLLSIEERMQFFLYNNEMDLFEPTIRRFFSELILARQNCKKYIEGSEKVQMELKNKSAKILKELMKFKKFENKGVLESYVIKFHYMFMQWMK